MILQIPSSSKAVLFLLTCLTFLLGTVSYLSIYNRENKLVRSQFNSIKNQFSFGVSRELENKKNCLLTMGTYFETEFPNASQWPNVAIPVAMDTYKRLSDPLQAISRLRTIELVPFVKPDEIKSFENATYSYFKEEGREDLGVSDFGKGIFINDENGTRVREVDGSSSKGRYDMLTPVLHVGNLAQNSRVVMFNGYTETMRASTIDYAIDNCTRNNRQCFATTNFIYIVQDNYYRPACLINHPVYATDPITGNNITTGLIVGVFNWDTVFEDAVPTSGTSGIEARVISDTGEENVFRFKDGMPIHVSKRSSHPVYDSVHVPVQLQRTSYTIHLVFTDEFVEQYYSGFLMTGITVVSVLAFLSLLFIWHDTVMTRQKKNNDLVLDTKRLFVRYISHEIRTPLNTVHLGLQTLQEEVLGLVQESSGSRNPGMLIDFIDTFTEWASFLSHIDESTGDAIKVVSDLIDFDKLNTGMLNIEKSINEILPLIVSTISPFKIQARSKHITIDDSNLDNHMMHSNGCLKDNTELSSLVVFGDSIKLQQVIRNLVSNAMKFTPEEGVVTVTVSWKEEITSTSTIQSKSKKSDALDMASFSDGYLPFGCIELSIRDSGAGMTPEQVAQLFQEGVQFDANKLQAGQGSGLGLWISKGVVEKHYGVLRAESEGKGLGAEFILELPVYRPIEQGTPKHSCLRQPSNLPNSPIDGVLVAKRTSSHELTLDESISNIDVFNRSFAIGSQIKDKLIMVVDDTPSTRKVICRLLKNCGCRTIEASDGQQGLDLFLGSSKSFDLILMDFEMPVLNGPDATAKLIELGCKVPIIGVTGNVMKEDVDNFLSKGAVEVITKPVSSVKLKEVISHWLYAEDQGRNQTSTASISIQSKESTILPSQPPPSSSPSSYSPSSPPPSSSLLPPPPPMSLTDTASSSVACVNKTRRKVLVVDDVASTRKVLCRFLTRCKCDTTQASDGKECVDIVTASQKEPFDLILMDNEMPVMNGPDATAKLIELGCKVPIVAVTGHALKEDVDHFLSKGAVEVVTKPLDVQKVHSILDRWTKEPTIADDSTNKGMMKSDALTSTNTSTSGSFFSASELQLSTPQSLSRGIDHKNDEWFMMALNL